MDKKETEKIIVYTLLNHKDKWVSIPGIMRASGLPYEKVEAFINQTDLIRRAKKKNRRGNVLYTLREEAKALYQLEKSETTNIFADVKSLLLDGRLKEAISQYFQILKQKDAVLPKGLNALYKDKLISISEQYYLLEELWSSDEISTQERFEASDKFIYDLYESILEIELLIEEIDKYKFKFKNVVIKIDRDFDSFKTTDQKKILSDISSLLEVPVDEINVKAIEAGSVVMTLEFDNSEQAETLFMLIKLGKLKQDGIFDAKLRMLSEKIESGSQATEHNRIGKLAKEEIRKGNIKNAIQLLLDKLEAIGPSFQNQLIMLSSDLEILHKKSSLGLEKPEDIRIMRNRITYALLELIDKIK